MRPSRTACLQQSNDLVTARFLELSPHGHLSGKRGGPGNLPVAVTFLFLCIRFIHARTAAGTPFFGLYIRPQYVLVLIRGQKKLCGYCD